MQKKGILLHITSLPSRFGLGSIGTNAYAFADYLFYKGYSIWEVLPINPTDWNGSPYQSYASFAINPELVDVNYLVYLDLINDKEREAVLIPQKRENGHFKAFPMEMNESRARLLYKAMSEAGEFIKNTEEGFEEFCQKNAYWLDDYVLFIIMSIETGKPWYEWEADIRSHEAAEIKKYTEKYFDKITCTKRIQYILNSEWNRLRRYCGRKNIQLMGDIPMYMASNSADVWANQELFVLNSEGRPSRFAGAPPDAYSEKGQCWKAPVYNWEEMKKQSYSWWQKRISRAAEMFDIARLDHFRGFDRYWSTDEEGYGRYDIAGGKEVIDVIKQTASENKLELIAEDLGDIDEPVKQLLSYSGFKGTRVVRFGFDDFKSYSDIKKSENINLPHNHERNSVAYIGNHDCETLVQWLSEMSNEQLIVVAKYFDFLGYESIEELAKKIKSELPKQSEAEYIIYQMQDILLLGGSARMNTPGTESGNWQFMLSEIDV